MLVILMSGTFLAALNQTLLSPALPSIMLDLSVSAATAQWLVSGYALVEAVTIPLSAYLLGRLTTRQLFIGGMCLFSAGSLLATLAPSFWAVLLGRILQAACTGAAMPMVTTVTLLVFPAEKRGMAMGTAGLVIGVAPAAGPPLAGLLVDQLSWRAMFAIVFALSLLVVLVSFCKLENFRRFKRTSFDIASVVLSTVGLSFLLYGFSTLSTADGAPFAVALMAVGTAAVALYAKRQLSLAEPMLEVRTLKTRRYASSIAVIMLVQSAYLGVGVVFPMFIQNAQGLSAMASGAAMLPGALLGAVMGLVGGRLFDRFGVRRTSLPGLALMALGATALSLLGPEAGFTATCLSYTLLSLAMQATLTPLNTWGINALDNGVVQHAQGITNTLIQVASAFGTALLVSISDAAANAAVGIPSEAQANAGCHAAFVAAAAILCAALLAALLLTRIHDAEPHKAKRASANADEGTPSETPAR